MALNQLFQSQGSKRADASTTSPPKRQRQSPSTKPKGRGKGSQASDATSDASLISVMAKLVLRHEDSLNSMLSDIAYVSYMRTDNHSVVHTLASSSQEWKQDQSIAESLHMHQIFILLQIILPRMDQFESDKTAIDHLKQKGQCIEGRWHFEAWSPDSKKLAITATEPLEAKKVKEIINRILHLIRTSFNCVRIFKTSRPLAEYMTGGPVRVMMQFSINSPSELFKLLDSPVHNAVFELVNADFQRHSLVRSPLAIQVGNSLS